MAYQSSLFNSMPNVSLDAVQYAFCPHACYRGLIIVGASLARGDLAGGSGLEGGGRGPGGAVGEGLGGGAAGSGGVFDDEDVASAEIMEEKRRLSRTESAGGSHGSHGGAWA